MKYYQRIYWPFPVVVVSGIITIDEEAVVWDGGFTLQDFRDAQQELAEEQGNLFIDGRTLVPQNQIYFSDSHHLNNAGSVEFATNITVALQALDLLPANYP